nr:DUF4282 domain-containing protein [Corynebacterium lactis]
MDNQNPSNGAANNDPWSTPAPGSSANNGAGFGAAYTNPAMQQPAPNGGNNGGLGNMSSVTAESRNFFQALFDFSFSSFITIKFAKVIYLLNIIVAVLSYFFWVVMGFNAGFAATGYSSSSSSSVGLGFFVLLFGWIPALIQIISVRLILEMFIAIVRTAQNTSALREAQIGH